MAIPSIALIEALKETADRLEKGAYYQWTHQGSCNCGHLAQTITKFTKEEIHRFALEKEGMWEDHALAFCPTSGYTVDHIIKSMVNIGLTTEDIANLEKLSDKKVLSYIPYEKRQLKHNKKEDVILYMRAFSQMLEDKLFEINKNQIESNLNKAFKNYVLIDA